MLLGRGRELSKKIKNYGLSLTKPEKIQK